MPAIVAAFPAACQQRDSTWRALYCRVHGTANLPTEPPSLAQVVLWIARLGGYLARKHDRPFGADRQLARLSYPARDHRDVSNF
jgi:hypothetical protein